MVAIGLLSAKGSPGCTTTALALSQVWADASSGRQVLLAECDAAGGDIATGFLSGNVSGRGALGLASSRTSDPMAAVWDELLALDDEGRRLLLLGITDPRHAERAGVAWSVLADALPDLSLKDVDVLIDVGRLSSAHAPLALWRSADLLVLVTRSNLTAVAAAQGAVARLTETDVLERVCCLVVEERNPYSGSEVAEALGIPLIGVLPLEGREGRRLLAGNTGGAPRAKSALLRACKQVAIDLIASPSRGAVSA